MADVVIPDETRGISRRYFLKTTAGAVAVTILQPPLFGYPLPGYAGEIEPAALSPSPVPGRADQRIEGLAKVTGQKIYARDFHYRDMRWRGGRKQQQYYAMYLRAVQTDDLFIDVNLDRLPDHARPKYKVLGDDKKISVSMNKRVLSSRDLHIDERIEAETPAKAANLRAGEGFDRPHSLDLDLIVKPGNRPDFLGQAVALLVFDSHARFRAARRLMQFHDADFQIYRVTSKQPSPRPPFQPITDYVLWTGPDQTPEFSYAGFRGKSKDYLDKAEPYVKKIDEFSDDSTLIQQTFSADMSAMDPMFMEPEAGLAWYESKTKTLHLVLGTQSPDGDVKEVLSMYGESDSPLEVANVELTSCYPGGGFGGRDKSPFTPLLATAAAFADGHPIRLEYDRFEQFQVGLKRHACRLDGTLVVSPSNQAMKVIEMNLTFDGGGRKNLSPYVANLAALCAGGSYAVPMANIHAQADPSTNISGGSQRGFGGPQAFFGIETAIDDVAVQQGWDPIEFRRKNILSKGGYTVAGGRVEQELRLDDMLYIAGTHPLWDERDKWKNAYGGRDLVYGTGVAMSLQAYGTSGDGVVAAVLMDELGRFTVQSDAVDMGNGSATTLGVVIGEILGANAGKVEMGGYKLFDQTGLGLFGYRGPRDWENENKTAKAVGSSSACLTGLHQVHIVQQVARAYFAGAILPAARKLWGNGAVNDTAWDGNGNLTTEGHRPLPLAELAGKVYKEGLARGAVGHAFFQGSWASADYKLESGQRRFEMDGLAFYGKAGTVLDPVPRLNATGPQPDDGRASRFVWAPCVNVIGLTVNTKSGAVQIENVLSVLNAGRIHVEPLVKGQSQGGIAQAIGWTLMESVPTGIHGPANGTWNLNAYHVPRWQDVPLATTFTPGGRSQELILMPETPGDKGQGRGIAEAVMCSIAPAISNALKDAVGKRYTSLPITPDKILKGPGS